MNIVDKMIDFILFGRNTGIFLKKSGKIKFIGEGKKAGDFPQGHIGIDQLFLNFFQKLQIHVFFQGNPHLFLEIQAESVGIGVEGLRQGFVVQRDGAVPVNIFKQRIIFDIGLNLGIRDLRLLGKEGEQLQETAFEHHVIPDFGAFRHIQPSLCICQIHGKARTGFIKGKKIMPRQVLQLKKGEHRSLGAQF